MKYYKVTMVLALEDEASHPRKWVNETITESLNGSEDILDIKYSELTDEELDNL